MQLNDNNYYLSNLYIDNSIIIEFIPTDIYVFNEINLLNESNQVNNSLGNIKDDFIALNTDDDLFIVLYRIRVDDNYSILCSNKAENIKINIDEKEIPIPSFTSLIIANYEVEFQFN